MSGVGIGGGAGIGVDRGAAIDTKRGLLVFVGAGETLVYDIANKDYTKQVWNTTGGEFNTEYYRPGVNYDPVADRIVVWDGGAVHALNMDTREWVQLAEAPQDHQVVCVQADRGCKRGTYGRFRYSPRENAYIAVNDSTLNVMVYKMTDPSASPTITSQPSSQMVEEGQAATFSVVAVGAGPLSYQWRRNGTAIAGATAVNYVLPAVSVDDNGAVFDCVVSNAKGTTTTTSAVLTVTSDSVAPSLEAVRATSATTVVIRFSEPVTQASAEQASNYGLDGGRSVLSAQLGADIQTVRLTVSELRSATNYTLTVGGIQDRAPTPNTISPFSSQIFTYLDAEGFEGGDAGNWAPQTPARWEVVLDEGDNAYYLNTSSFSAQSGDRLGEYSLLLGSYDDFELTLQAKLGDSVDSNAFADYAIVFGYQDENNYYYMMFNNDKSYSRLYKVVNGVRSSVAATASDWVNDNAYHEIGIRRDNSEITVTYDGVTVIKVVDSSFGAGQVGVGSFNDSAYFDDIRISALNTGSGVDIGGDGSDSDPVADGGSGSTGPLLSLALLSMACVRRRRMYRQR